MRITIATTHATYPPHSGAALRNFHLYRGLARRHEVEILALAKRDSGTLNSTIAPGLREIRIPVSLLHLREELRLCERASGHPVSDIAAARLYRYTPEYLAALKVSCEGADIVVASHPHLIHALRDLCSKPLIYETPDVELDLQRALLPDTSNGRQFLSYVETTEALCIAEADLVVACSDEDKERLIQLYGVRASKIHVAPNGSDSEGIPFIDRTIGRAGQTRSMQVEGGLCCVFLASWATFNVEAANCILAMAQDLPQVSFLIAGTVGLALNDCAIPRNVKITGAINEPDKLELLAKCDVALNPVQAGSGSNIKMGEYFASGLPAITTSFGLRGWGNVPAFVRSPDEFVEAIRCLESAEGYRSAIETARAARHWVELNRSWRTIGESLTQAIEALPLSVSPAGGREDKVAVLIAMLDAELFIEECLNSVLQQTHQNLEVFVVDDGCRDGSAAIVKAIAARDHRVHLLRHPCGENRGVSRSLELALRHCRAEYVALLDADDAFEPEKLATQLRAMRAEPDAVLCHCLPTIVAESDTELSRSIQANFDVRPSTSVYQLLPSGLSACHIVKSSALVRRAALENVRFAGRQLYQSEDWLLMILLAAKGRFVFVDERLVRYRVHPASYTSRVLSDPIKELYGRLEMFLRLLSQTSEQHDRDAVKHHMDGVLWSLERVYGEDAPAVVLSPPKKSVDPQVLQLQLDAMLASRSWQITAPLRGMAAGIRRLTQHLSRKPFARLGYQMRVTLARAAQCFWPSNLVRQAKLETIIALKFAVAKVRFKSKFKGQSNLRVNVGCGPNVAGGYVNLDVVSHPDVFFWDCRRSLPFEDGALELIFAEHVFEHFEYKNESLRFLKECHRCLKGGGVLRLVVPDAGRYLSLYDAPWERLMPVRPFVRTDDGYWDVWLNAA